MAKIILQASSFQKNYNIDTVAVSMSQYETSKGFALEVKPKAGYIVDASDFYSGYIQDEIESVVYSNTNRVVDFNNNVRVDVVLKDSIVLKGNENIIVFVPVNGEAKIASNKLTFIDSTTREEGINVIDELGVITLRDSNISKNNHSNTYVVEGVSGEAGVIMQKTFEAENGYYIASPPSWKLKSRLKSNYSITTQEFKDDNNDLVKKVYKISYVFPKDKFTAKYEDKIIFS